MQTIVVNGEEMQVVRSFCEGPNGNHILERPDGSYTYMDGAPVKHIGEFDFLPPEHREDAREWFRRKDKPPVPKEITTDEMKAALKEWGVRYFKGAGAEEIRAKYQEAKREREGVPKV